MRFSTRQVSESAAADSTPFVKDRGTILPGVSLLLTGLAGLGLVLSLVGKATPEPGAALVFDDTMVVWGPDTVIAPSFPDEIGVLDSLIIVPDAMKRYFVRARIGEPSDTTAPLFLVMINWELIVGPWDYVTDYSAAQTDLTMPRSQYEVIREITPTGRDTVLLALVGYGGEQVVVSIEATDAAGPKGIVWGKEDFTSSGGTDVFVEALGLTPVEGRSYHLGVKPGDIVEARDVPDSTWIILNGDTLYAPPALEVVEGAVVGTQIELLGNDTLVVVTVGDGDEQVTLWLQTEVPRDALFSVFGPATFTKSVGVAEWDTALAIAGDAAPPSFVVVKNGHTNGTNRVTAAEVTTDLGSVLEGWQVHEGVDTLWQQAAPIGDSLYVSVEGDSGAFLTVELFATDEFPPVLEDILPAEDAVVAGDTVTVTGTFSDRTPTAITVNGVSASIDGDAFSADVPLTGEGANVLTISAVDGGGLETDSVRTIYRDQAAPVLTVTAPADLTVTAATSVTVSGTVSDASEVSVTVNAVPFTVVAGAFSGSVSLDPGPNTITVVATDEAENSSFVIRTVTRDNDPPTLIVSAPGDGSMTAESSVTVSGVVYDLTALTLTVDGVTTTVASDSTFSISVSLDEGVNHIPIVAVDAAGNKDSVSRMVTRESMELPPDPVTVAPALSQTVATTLYEANSFLWTGPDSIQTGVDSGTIDPLRVGVYRGLVLNTMGMPLPGATVRVKDHAELGQTLSRSDGMFDLGVNAGGTLTLEYSKDGYLPVHRDIRTGWQEFRVVDSIVMTALDTNATMIDFSDPIEVARGSMVTDSSGTRQATLLFRQGTVAALEMPDGSLDTVSAINVRATEFTVGDLGEAAMPARLPASTAYTYALEMSADTAIAAGAVGVHFDQPVAAYIENFLDIPIGALVPHGYYDRVAGMWRPEPDGVVLRIVDVDSLGRAVVSVDTSGAPASQGLLDSLDITTDELETLASLYDEGTEVWRVLTSHFSPCDWNFALYQGLRDHGPNAFPDSLVDESKCNAGGSIIGCERQTLGEMFPVTGTPYLLAYRNDRMPGWDADRRIRFPALTDIDTTDLESLPRNRVPSHSTEVVYRIEAAGSVTEKVRTKETEMIPVELVWDGLDGYKRPVCGTVDAKVTIGFRYRAGFDVATMGGGGGGGGGGFGVAPRAIVISEAARQRITVVSEFKRTMEGKCPERAGGIGGWDLDVHHTYDPTGKVLTMGTGERRVAEPMGNIIKLVPGTQGSVVNVGGTLFFDRAFPVDPEAAPDGSIFLFYPGEGLIRRLWPNDSLSVHADSVPAAGIGLAPDGTIYAALETLHQVARIDTAGNMTIVAGTGTAGGSGDGGLAVAAQLNTPSDVAVGPDGVLYVTERNGNRVRRIGRDGYISLFAGNGGTLFSSSDFEDSLAINVPIPTPNSIEVDKAGNVYIGTQSLVRRVSPDGVLRTAAGRLQFWTGDTPATQHAIGGGPWQLEVTDDGMLYVNSGHAIWRVTQAGDISLAAGSNVPLCSVGCQPDNGDNGIATQSLFHFVIGVAVTPDGAMYLADNQAHKIRRVRPSLPKLGLNEMLIASEDGSEVYRFDRYGTHLATLDGLSGDTLLTFAYDSTGLLSSVTDAFGNTTTITRGSSGAPPTAITGPYGHVTTLTTDGNGYLATMTDPLGNLIRTSMDTLGLLDSIVNPRGYRTRFAYDDLGRLVADSNAVGGFVALARTEGDTGFAVTKTTAMGRVTTYEQLFGSDGASILRVTDPAGLTSESRRFLNGATSTTGPDGTSVTLVEGADPRYGSQAPLLKSLTIVTPDSLVSTITANRSVVLDDEDDPFSVVSITDQVTANGRTATRTYVDSTRTFTDVSPEGRQVSTTVDSLGRVTQVSAPAFASVEYRYDLLGRLDSIISGGRTAAFTYDSLGRLATSTDPLGRTDSLFYDEADRLERQVLPGNREILFSYDSVGNLISLTPPSRPTHGFSYTAVNLTETYDPPGLGLATPSTTYGYNLDRQLTSITRPDSVVIGIGYDSAGRLSQVTFNRGTIGMSYHPTTGNLIKLEAPGEEELSYLYDGSLPTRVTWSGSVQGIVELEYDSDFRVVSQAVSGDTVAFEYDDDGLLTRAGELVMERSDTTGFLTRDSLGSVVAPLLRVFHNYVLLGMESHISATELARRLGDILGRIRYRGESFVVDRNGAPVARIGPVAGAPPSTLGNALAAWRSGAGADSAFAADLARVDAADQPPANPWVS